MNKDKGEKLRYSYDMFSQYPMEGDFPPLTEDDPDWMQPKPVYRPHTDVFYLGDPDDAGSHEQTKEDYERACKLVSNQRAIWDYRSYEWDEDEKAWRVVATWIEVVIVPGRKARQEQINI